MLENNLREINNGSKTKRLAQAKFKFSILRALW